MAYLSLILVMILWNRISVDFLVAAKCTKLSSVLVVLLGSKDKFENNHMHRMDNTELLVKN